MLNWSVIDTSTMGELHPVCILASGESSVVILETFVVNGGAPVPKLTTRCAALN
jgi:hypothetical protein